MNREILFRGKRIDNGEWVDGCYMTDEQDLSKAYIGHIFGTDGGGMFIHDMDIVRVVPETVCQYTGLTDKNGRRFEGDIFQASDGDYIQRYIITWNEDSLEWSAECVGDPDGTLPLSEFRVEEIEVIGNIFDNPALLEGGAE